MDLDQVKDAVKALTETDYAQLWVWMGTEEKERRASAAAVAKAEEKVVAEVWESHPELKPRFGGQADDAPAWVQPTGAHDAYPDQAYVTHNGRTWRNILGGLNSHEPAATGAGWEIVVPRVEDAGTGQVFTPGQDVHHPLPWEPGLPLSPGQFVSYGDKLYKVKAAHMSHDGWKPGPDTHAVFEEVPAPRPGAATG